MPRKSKEFWKKYNQNPRRKAYQKDLMSRRRVQRKNAVAKPKESCHGKYRDPDYHRKYMREKRDWEVGFPVSRPYSRVPVIDIYPDGTYARPREKESVLNRKFAATKAGKLLSCETCD